MKSNQTRSTGLLLAAMLLGAGLPADGQAGEAGAARWQEISAVQDRKTHLIPSTWTLDKYPDAPILTAKSKVTLIDQKGPGVVTLLHVSDYQDSRNCLIVRVWYDHEQNRPIFTYKHDLGEPHNHATRKGKAPALQPFVKGESLDVPYRSCIYYYATR